jgi:uncharacterized protein (TIGR02996 family)
MNRYELGEDPPEKFWETWIDGVTLYTRFGKIGSQGQTKLKKCATPDAAAQEQARFVAGKEKEGFRLVSSGQAPKRTKPNPELEKAIVEDPSSPDGYLVYGDWLTEQGDPLGEYVAVEAARAKSPQDKALATKSAELFLANKAAWLGDLELGEDIAVEWEFGFLKSARFGGDEYSELDAADAYEKLRKLPTSRFLRELEFWVFDDDDGQPSYTPVLKALAKLGVPATLRKLAFDVMGYQTSWTSLGDLSKIYELVPRLEELRIHVGSMKLGTFDLPNLRRLEIKTGGLSKDNLRSVATASWDKLEALILYFGADEYGGNCKIEDLAPIFEGKNLPRLTHLGLTNSEFQDEIARAIVESQIAKQLTTLDLSKGVMGDEGAEALIAGAKVLKKLEKLDLTENYISDEMADRLIATFGKNVVDVSEQGDDPEEDRYVQVAE